MELIGNITLGVGHSLILGNVPRMIDPSKLSKLITEETTAEVESFGLWESSSPNYSTYYPDVTAEDLKPNEDEFIEPVFRLLSEVIVYKGIPIDFTKKGILKKSMSKLLGQTVNIDHEVMVGNAIGAVSKVFWQDSYKTKTGVVVPAGINGVLKIDGKSNPRIARGIMMEPPSIHSNSVTVRYKWEPSHKFDKSEEFYQRIGTYDNEGELIRCVVKEIMSYSETSLVSHGADPFAQKQVDGEIVNPDFAANRTSFAADKTIGGSIYYDIKEHESGFRLDATIPGDLNNTIINKTTEIEMDELIKQLTEGLGLKENELTQENAAQKLAEALQNKDTEIQGLKDTVSDLESEKGTQATELTALQSKVDNLESNSAEAAEILKLTREEATRLYKLVKTDKADDAILSMLGESNLKMASAFVKQYREEAENQFAATCNECGSKDVSRASANTSKDGLKTDEDGKARDDHNTEKSNADVIESFRTAGKRKSRIFGEQNKKN